MIYCGYLIAGVINEMYHTDTAGIEAFLDRTGEITDEEISRADILEHCSRETGLDVSGLILR